MAPLTIGVAIAVPEPLGPQLQQWRADFGDPLAWSIPAHVTLVPPTPIGGPCIEEVADHLRAVAADSAPFDISLGGTDTFRPVSPVVFVALARGGEQCAALEARVRTGVLDVPRRFPYHPHITVAHDLPDEALNRASTALADYRAAFTADSLGLFRHGADGVWRPAAHFTLGG